MKGFWANGLFALSLVHGASALAAEGLTDILDKAKLADPSYLGAGFVRAAEQEAIVQARSRLLPNLSATLDQTQNRDKILESENQVANASSASYKTNTYSIALTQSIYNHENWVRYRQSKLIVERADVDFDKARQDLLISVAQNYFTLLKTSEQLAAISAEKEALSRHVEYASKSRAAGLGRKSEVVDAEARYFTALAEEASFIKALDDARYALMELTGELPGDLRPIQESLPLSLPDPAVAQPWIERGLSQSPDVLSQQLALQESQAEIKAQNAGHYPSLDLVFRQNREKQGGSLFGGASEVDNGEVALRIDVPLYSGGSVSSGKREAIERMYKTQQDLNKIRRTVHSEVNSSFQGIIANIAQVRALKRTVASQQSVLRNKQRGHQAGLYTMLVVLDAQRDLADAQRNYIEARYDYVINSLNLKRAAGVLVEQDLIAVSEWLQ